MNREAHVSLGLVLQFAALTTLPRPLFEIVGAVTEREMTQPLLMALFIAYLVFQVVLGALMSARSRLAPMLSWVWLGASVVVAALGAYEIAMVSGVGWSVAGYLVGVLAAPAIVLAVPTARPAASPRLEAATMLSVTAWSAVISVALRGYAEVTREDPRSYYEVFIVSITMWVPVAIAVISLHAASRLRSGPVLLARKALLFYLVAIVSLRCALAMVTISGYLLLPSIEVFPLARMTVTTLISVAASIGIAVVIWHHARTGLRDDAPEPARSSPPLVAAWGALWLAPLVLGYMTDATGGPAFGIVFSKTFVSAATLIFIVTSAALAVAGIAALRDSAWAFGFALVALVLSLVVFALGIYANTRGDTGVWPFTMWPAALLVTTSAALARSCRVSPPAAR